MITKHGKDQLTLSDGQREHKVAHADFAPMKPHAKGGIHPAVTEDHQAWLAIDQRADLSECPVKPTTVEHPDEYRAGKTITATYLPITAYLQAYYGPDKQIVTVPINGDANAQRLHWLKRTKKDQAEMKAVLQWMGAWRLTDTGDVPKEA